MAVSHFVRRGLEVMADGTPGQPGDKVPVIQAGPAWLVSLLVLTLTIFICALISIEYTYGLLVPTLAAVEDSTPDLYIRVDADPTNKHFDDPNGLEISSGAPRPITSKLRTTIRHLRNRAGRRSSFRGFGMFMLCNMIESLLFSFVPLSANSIFGRFVAKLVIAILLANFQVAWVHIVISEPSPKRFYKRIPSLKNLPKILPAAAFEQILITGSFYATLFIIKCIHGLPEFNEILYRNNGSPAAIQSAVNIISVASFVSWLASIPARAIFVRVAASTLPEEDEAIVPFDRSFGGKVVPNVVGGGVLSITDAWKTFDWDAKKRYVKAILKACAIEFAVTILFSTLVMAEVLGGALVYKPKN